MGLFDSIAKLAKSVSDIVSDTTGPSTPDVQQNAQQYQEETRRLERQATQDSRPFDVKLHDVTSAIPGCQVDFNISPDFLEAQAGRQIYKRGGNRCLPQDFNYVLSYNGKSVYIRLWKRYPEYDHVANRAIRAHCDLNGIKVLDFFDYLPNGVNYIRQRVVEALEIRF